MSSLTAPSQMMGRKSCSKRLKKKQNFALQPAKGIYRQRPLRTQALLGSKACNAHTHGADRFHAYVNVHLDLRLICGGHRAGIRPASGKRVVAGGCFKTALGRSCCGRFPPAAPHTGSRSMAHLLGTDRHWTSFRQYTDLQKRKHVVVLLEARSVSVRGGLSGCDSASMQWGSCFSAQGCPERSHLMTHLRRLLRSSLAERAAARALMKCIQVASMLLASSRFGTKAQSALGCTAGLTT